MCFLCVVVLFVCCRRMIRLIRSRVCRVRRIISRVLLVLIVVI